MDSTAGMEPGWWEQLLGELPPNTSSSPPAPPGVPALLGVFRSRTGSRAHPCSGSHRRKARTLKWNSQIQFSLANWASAHTRLRGGERPARCSDVPPGLRRRPIMMVFVCGTRVGSRDRARAAGGAIRGQEEPLCPPHGELGTLQPLSDANRPPCQPQLPAHPASLQKIHTYNSAAARAGTGTSVTPVQPLVYVSKYIDLDANSMGVSRISKHLHIYKGVFLNMCKWKPSAWNSAYSLLS